MKTHFSREKATGEVVFVFSFDSDWLRVRGGFSSESSPDKPLSLRLGLSKALSTIQCTVKVWTLQTSLNHHQVVILNETLLTQLHYALKKNNLQHFQKLFLKKLLRS